jgi:hypothetical protein
VKGSEQGDGNEMKRHGKNIFLHTLEGRQHSGQAVNDCPRFLDGATHHPSRRRIEVQDCFKKTRQQGKPGSSWFQSYI